MNYLLAFLIPQVAFFVLRYHRPRLAGSETTARVCVLLSWGLAYFLLPLVFLYPSPPLLMLVALLLVFLLPALFSKCFAYFGWVKASFFTALTSSLYFQRDQFSGALCRAVMACQRIRDQNKYAEAMAWLHLVMKQHDGTSASGSLVMREIIRLLNQTDYSPKEAFERLNSLYSLNKQSIPGPVAAMALRMSLVYPLSQGDWPAVCRVAKVWNVPGFSPFTRYVVSYCAWLEQDDRRQRRSVLFLRPLMLFSSLPKKLQQLFLETQCLKNQLDEFPRLAAWVPASAALKTNVLHRICDDRSAEYWVRRGRELGVYDSDGLWQELTKQAQRTLTPQQWASTSQDERRLNQIEADAQRMNVLLNALLRRIDRGETLYISDHLTVWSSVILLYKHHRYDIEAQDALFIQSNRNLVCWLEQLWVHGKEYYLASAIARHLLPIAQRNAHHELVQWLTQMVDIK